MRDPVSNGITTADWLTLHGMVTVLAILLYVVTAHVKQQRRSPSAAISWILFILLVPYLALPVFLSFGSRKLSRPPGRHPAAPVPVPRSDGWAIETIRALGQPEPAEFRDLSVHLDGADARRALFDAIDGARHSIDLCTFILGRDAFGSAVLERLCARLADGVRVRLLVDGMGRLMAARPDLKPFVRRGGELAVFVPPLRSPLKGRTNLRDHRKMLIVDAAHPRARLWCGGRNLAAEYFEGRPGHPPWRDLSFDMSGPLVRQAAQLFEHDWAFALGRPVPPAVPGVAAPAAFRGGAQIVASGPDQTDDTVYSLLVTAAYRARERIVLSTPYFVPEAALLMALCLAARRGVAVDLLLPARSNHRLSDVARGRALRALEHAGGRVWLVPGMLHAKMAVVDETLALAGSANLDSRSLFLNYELMVAFHGRADILRFLAWFEQERVPATRYVARSPSFLRDVGEGMLLWVGFQI